MEKKLTKIFEKAIAILIVVNLIIAVVDIKKEEQPNLANNSEVEVEEGKIDSIFVPVNINLKPE